MPIKVMRPTSFDDLPEETAVEILLKLGVKDLIRSTSVNKTWYSLINNPSFISSQICKAISCCDDNAVLIIPPVTSQQNYCSLISADTSSLIEKFDIPFETKSRSLKLVAQIHGMLLLTDLHIDHSCRDLYLWNPYVKTHRVLVSTCYKTLLDNLDETFCTVGIGFDKLINDLKIVRVIYVKDEKGNFFGEVAPKVEIYSFGENRWRMIKNPRVPRLVYERGIYVDGCYYWSELKQPGTEEAHTVKKVVIVSFDFRNELFREFKLPHDVPRYLGTEAPAMLMQFKDSLAVCVIHNPLHDKGIINYPYCIWVMRQEKGVVTWTMCFRTLLKELGYPLDITKNGTLIMESLRSKNLYITCIVSCNLKSMIYKDHGFDIDKGPTSAPGLGFSTVNTSFPESLIMYERGKSVVNKGGKSNNFCTLSPVLQELFKLSKCAK